jgi:hypothetical protein
MMKSCVIDCLYVIYEYYRMAYEALLPNGNKSLIVHYFAHCSLSRKKNERL